mgnify:CR=1 FL=1|tara:strand:- start:6000 stop:6476 length:477 start_codon:yes stop_codon:yes gene_type:complete
MKIKSSDMGIISNCPLCGSHSLHLMNDGIKTQQCINCGYATSDNLESKNEKEISESLSDDMRNWYKVENGKVWLPSFITLPIGMVFPLNDEDENGETMKWAFAPMVEIPEDERHNFPIEGKDGQFHTQKYDTDKAKIFDDFILALSEMNELSKYVKNE